MKLFTVFTLASMAALASAADPWRARFYCRTEFKGGAIQDDKGSTSKACTNIRPCPPRDPDGDTGALSMQFENNPPPTCTVTVFNGVNCSGASATYTGTTGNVANFATSPPNPSVKSYLVTCTP